MTPEQRERVERWASLWERDAQNLFSNGFDKRGAEFDADAAALRALLAEADTLREDNKRLLDVLRGLVVLTNQWAEGADRYLAAGITWEQHCADLIADLEDIAREEIALAARSLRQEGKG